MITDQERRQVQATYNAAVRAHAAFYDAWRTHHRTAARLYDNSQTAAKLGDRAAGITLDELGGAVGVSRQNAAKWLRKGRRPSSRRPTGNGQHG